MHAAPIDWAKHGDALRADHAASRRRFMTLALAALEKTMQRRIRSLEDEFAHSAEPILALLKNEGPDHSLHANLDLVVSTLRQALQRVEAKMIATVTGLRKAATFPIR